MTDDIFHSMAANHTPRPTGKNGRGLPARNRCCACGGSGTFRIPSTGQLTECTNCYGTGRL